MIYHTARYADKLAEAVAKGDETAIKKSGMIKWGFLHPS